MISKELFIGIGIVIGLAVGLGVGFSFSGVSSESEKDSQVLDMQSVRQMMEQMNKVSHFEIPYEDQERAQKFYEEVFGWQITKFSDEGYYLAFTTKSDPNTMMPSEPGSINGGLLKRDSTAKHPLLVIDVPNIDEHIKKIEDAGGELIMPKVSVGDSGFFARVADTEGNVIAIWQQLKP